MYIKNDKITKNSILNKLNEHNINDIKSTKTFCMGYNTISESKTKFV